MTVTFLFPARSVKSLGAGQTAVEKKIVLQSQGTVLICTKLTLSLLSSKSTFSQPFKEKCVSEVARICSIIIFHLSKPLKVKFSILCAVIFLVRLQEKFDSDHSQE